MKPIIGITMGDPAGIGPEIVLKFLSSSRAHRNASYVVFGSDAVFCRVARTMGRPMPVRHCEFVETSPWLKMAPPLGAATASGGKSAGDAVSTAVGWAMAGKIHAVVTAPINKDAFKKGGWGKLYPGHTEMLAALTRSRESALMMVYENMRVIHVTSHIPLREVASSLTTARVFRTILLANQATKDLGVARPRIAVCGLNPHAGDNGVLGTEDVRIVAPAVRRAVRRGLKIIGPLSADALWPAVWAKQFDVGVAMYHDQGQIPMKLLAFHASANGVIEPRGVNVTIGLPIIRTSVAHGSAYSLAGKNVASAASLFDAVDLAVKLTHVRHR